MRLVSQFDSVQTAKRFVAYLAQNQCPALVERDENQHSVWVYEEDQFEQAQQLLQKFSSPDFEEKISEEAVERAEEKKGLPISEDPVFIAQMEEMKKKLSSKALYRQISAKLTRFFVLVCLFFLFINIGYQYSQYTEGGTFVPFTPLDRLFFYDQPVLPDDQTAWPGIYPLIDGSAPTSLWSAPKFGKIGSGQIWRVFTPCLLHAGLIHLAFNMLWFWALGKHIEERLALFKYVLLILIIGIVSNTCQYFMSGPNFLGFSGIVSGLAGFIWMKKKIAPWEGYPIPKSTLNFLFIFIFSVAGLQAILFIVTLFQSISFPIAIANTAHVSGLLTGVFLGRLNYFSRQSR